MSSPEETSLVARLAVKHGCQGSSMGAPRRWRHEGAVQSPGV